ncbi:MAG: hypothetical protein ACT4P4_04595, partial [Betaproteobacteria bacterium]
MEPPYGMLPRAGVKSNTQNPQSLRWCAPAPRAPGIGAAINFGRGMSSAFVEVDHVDLAYDEESGNAIEGV